MVTLFVWQLSKLSQILQFRLRFSAARGMWQEKDARVLVVFWGSFRVVFFLAGFGLGGFVCGRVGGFPSFWACSFVILVFCLFVFLCVCAALCFFFPVLPGLLLLFAPHARFALLSTAIEAMTPAQKNEWSWWDQKKRKTRRDDGWLHHFVLSSAPRFPFESIWFELLLAMPFKLL